MGVTTAVRSWIKHGSSITGEELKKKKEHKHLPR
jgi:hypothetical protein